MPNNDAEKWVAITDLALKLLEIGGPKIAELTTAGEVSAETQAALAARVSAIEDGSAFSDPAWKPEN